jgi:hypothetical protein
VHPGRGRRPTRHGEGVTCGRWHLVELGAALPGLIVGLGREFHEHGSKIGERRC